MPELFNGTLQTTIDNNDRIAFNQPGQSGSKNIIWSAFKTLLATLYVSLTGNSTVSGTVTFTTSPKVPNPSTGTDVVNLQTMQALGVMNKVQYASRTANFQHAISAGQSLERIDFRRISGSVFVKVGTSALASDVVSEKEVTTEDKNIIIGKSFNVNRTLYITITGGGTVSVNVWYLPLIW